MLISDKLIIRVHSKTISHYKQWYNNIKVGDLINISVNQLSKNSAVKVHVKCDICGNERALAYYKYNKNILKYNLYTCKKCFNIKNKKTNLEKYGSENYRDKKKYKETCLKKYGVDNVSKLEDVKLKKQYTTFKHYSVLNPMQCELIKAKYKNTMNEKFNGILMGSDILKEKIKTTNFNKIGVENPFSSNGVIKKIQKMRNDKTLNLYSQYNILSINDDIYTCKCDNNKNHTYDINSSLFYNRKKINTILCTICNPVGSFYNSGQEIQLQEFIKKYYNFIQNSKKIISPYELDIYLPDIKIAFEFNGLYWHNELNKNKNYHLNKTELCEEKGIQLIHIYEDDWLYKQDIIKSIILNKLNKTENKIYARKCIIKEVNDNNLIKEFLNKNHIQGFIGSKIKIGLFYQNELVSLMTFGNRRVAMGKKSTNEGEYELLRFCNKLNTNVVGGASKLFKYFVDNYNPFEITTYADRSFSQGNLYKQLGFNFIGKTEPNYYYVINYCRSNRFNFRKNILVKQGFDSNKTEHQIMLERNIYRIYDSGNLKYNIFI
jgi:hypothetical protein